LPGIASQGNTQKKKGASSLPSKQLGDRWIDSDHRRDGKSWLGSASLGALCVAFQSLGRLARGEKAILDPRRSRTKPGGALLAWRPALWPCYMAWLRKNDWEAGFEMRWSDRVSAGYGGAGTMMEGRETGRLPWLGLECLGEVWGVSGAYRVRAEIKSRLIHRRNSASYCLSTSLFEFLSKQRIV